MMREEVKTSGLLAKLLSDVQIYLPQSDKDKVRNIVGGEGYCSVCICTVVLIMLLFSINVLGICHCFEAERSFFVTAFYPGVLRCGTHN